MDLNNYDSLVLDRLTKADSYIQTMPIRTAYSDALAFVAVMVELENQAPWKRLHEVDPGEALRLANVYLMLASQLKALIVFASLYVDVFLNALAGFPKEPTDLSRELRGNPKCPFDVKSIDDHVLVQVLCNRIFRNKIVVHHDVIRIYGHLIDEDGSIRLSPMIKNLAPPSSTEIQAIDLLARKYVSSVPGLATENNYFEKLNLLFYGVPATCPDRGKILEDLAERGGVKSMYRKQIVKAVDDFTLAAVELYCKSAI